MAEDKKPRIDLKARLGKTAQQTPPPGVAGRSGGVPPPVVPGVPVGPPPTSFASSQAAAIDPSNPLAAVATPYRAPTPPPPPHAQRIEVDEAAVHHASGQALRKGVLIGAVLAVIVGIVGYVVGSSVTQSNYRTRTVQDAKDLSEDVGKARDSLKTLADKVEAGAKSLAVDRKFPDTLAKDLGGINVDFDGTKLAGRRFSGFPQDASHDLVDLVTSVQSINDRKDLISGLLTRLQKPITEQLTAPPGQQTISYVVAVDRDPSGNLAGFLASLNQPISASAQNIALPPRFAFASPGGGNTELPRYSGGDIATKPAAIYIVPKTFEKACPSQTSGQIAQLAAQMGEFVRDIRGEGDQGGGDQGIVTDTKPGLLQRADRLVTELNKVN